MGQARQSVPADDVSAGQVGRPSGQSSLAESSSAASVAGGPVDSSFTPSQVAMAAGVVAPPDMTGRVGRLGGYELVRKLGQGGMGTVYLARQVSLDRPVAVKVLAPRLADDPQFVARFTREAYAAAQLTHHNVVQIHDIGAQDESHYYSMEYVHGQSLAQLVKNQGKLDPEVAVGYILQAARGLKFAHDQGMIHRDVKPDNLLLNHQGIVKVADLGLVKTPGSAETVMKGNASTRQADTRLGRGDVTEANAMMGTPAYMAPEQAVDATKVDVRADIYSLGCTLYDLLTGRPPFVGNSAVEVMTKHAREAVVPPDRLVKHIPPRLSQIVLRMIAKKPDERYATADLLVADLEKYLGIESSGPFTPSEDLTGQLEAASRGFANASAASLRNNIARGFLALSTLGVVGLAILGWTTLAAGMFALGLFTVVSYFILRGITQRTHLFGKLRQLAASGTIGDWLKTLAGGLLIMAAIVLLGWFWVWLGFAVVSVGLAAAFHFGLDAMVRKQREPYLKQIEQMMMSMRMRGVDETAIRHFVCRYAGNGWEELYETLFGYEAKIDARQRWARGQRGLPRKRFLPLRDPIIQWIDAKLQEGRADRDRRLIQSAEVRAMEAQGVSEMEARRKAKNRAEAIVAAAAEVRQTALRQAATVAPGMTPAPPAVASKLRELTEEKPASEIPATFQRERSSYITRRYGGPLEMLFGNTMRFVCGAIILLGFCLWRYDNRDWERPVSELEKISDQQRVDSQDLIKEKSISAIKTIGNSVATDWGTRAMAPRWWIPKMLRDWFSTWNAGVAAIILLSSLFFRGRFFGLVCLLAAIITFVGYTLAGRAPPVMGTIPGGSVGQTVSSVGNEAAARAIELLGPPGHAEYVAMCVGLGLFVLAVFFLRDKELPA